jgi:Radical SAM proteins, N-terminal/Radical SAM superfamily
MEMHRFEKILILRLSNSRDTEASATHTVLAELCRQGIPEAQIDFAFLPPRRAPAVMGVQSGLDWSAFDLILVSNSFVQEAVNLPWFLAVNGLSPWASERPESFPPVILGGSNAFASQCLLCPDGKAVPDAIFFGEAEEMLPRFVRRMTEGHKDGRTQAGLDTRARLLRAVEGLDGFWVTGSLPTQSIKQAVVRSPTPVATMNCQLPLPTATLTGTARLTVSRGCPAFCSFCFEGYERKPYRETPLKEVLQRARFLKREYGARTVELDAFNLNMYADFVPLVKSCSQLFDRVSFKSQRADGIAACPEIIALERAAGKQSFTLGIEGISARMRAFLCKSLSDEDIELALQTLLSNRVREIKLFYILTGHEGPEDLAAFSSFCSRLQEKLRAPKCGTRVVLSFGRLVRMPNTPLMFDRLLLDEQEWRFCVDGVSATCRRAKLEFRFAFDWPDYLGTQLLAACGHEDAPAVVKLACEGLSYHGPWLPAEVSKLQSVVTVQMEPSQPFPFVQRPVTLEFLKKRWEEACDYRDNGYCLGSKCSACGACSTSDETRRIVRHSRAQRITETDIEAIASSESSKRRLPLLYRIVTLPESSAGLQPATLSAVLMRELLSRHPDLMENLLSVEEELFSFGENEDRFQIPCGKTVVAFRAWDRKALQRALADAAPLIGGEVPEGFQPGVFSKASCLLHTSLTPRVAAESGSKWLKDLHLAHTLCKAGEGWKLDLAPAALKKKMLYTCSLQPIEGGTCITLEFSSKLQLRDWISTLVRHPTLPLMTCLSIT